jgi:hypothetical protein
MEIAISDVVILITLGAQICNVSPIYWPGSIYFKLSSSAILGAVTYLREKEDAVQFSI